MERLEKDSIDLSKVNVFKLFWKYFIPTLLGMLGMSAATALPPSTSTCLCSP